MSETLKFGNGEWAVKEGSTLAYNDENGNFKPLPFTFDRSTSATRVNKEGLIEVVSNNEPRIDFLNDSKGALKLEPSRSNLITYSEDFSNIGWTKSNATPTISSELSPTGALNAYDVVFASSGFLLESVITTKTIGSSETISVFSKTDVSGTFLKYGGGTASGTDVENKESFGNGWYRYSVTRTFTEAETASTQIIISSAEVGLNVVLFGAQLEQGSYPTSYIPTQGSIGTRVVESCEQTVPDGIIGQTEGTVYLETKLPQEIPSSSNYFTISDGTENNCYIFQFRNNGNFRIYQNGLATADLAFLDNIIDFSQNNKIAFKYGQSISSMALYLNGVKISLQLGFVYENTTGINSIKMAYVNGSINLGAEIKEVKLYSTALTDAELRALTS